MGLGGDREAIGRSCMVRDLRGLAATSLYECSFEPDQN